MEDVSILHSREVQVKVKVTQSCPTLCDPMDCLQAGILEWVSFPFSRGLNPGLPHCRWSLYQLSHQGSPRILEWVAFLFSSRDAGIEPGSPPALQAESLPAELSFQRRLQFKSLFIKRPLEARVTECKP